jgi:hypothetical protein
MNVKLNGVDSGYLKSGKSIVLQKEIAIHELIVQIELFKSKPFQIDLKENDSKEIIVSNSQASDIFIFVFMLGLIGMIAIDFMNLGNSYVSFIRYAFFSIPILQLLYFTTIAKGKFFTINEKV